MKVFTLRTTRFTLKSTNTVSKDQKKGGGKYEEVSYTRQKRCPIHSEE